MLILNLPFFFQTTKKASPKANASTQANGSDQKDAKILVSEGDTDTIPSSNQKIDSSSTEEVVQQTTQPEKAPVEPVVNAATGYVKGGEYAIEYSNGVKINAVWDGTCFKLKSSEEGGDVQSSITQQNIVECKKVMFRL